MRLSDFFNGARFALLLILGFFFAVAVVTGVGVLLVHAPLWVSLPVLVLLFMLVGGVFYALNEDTKRRNGEA